jgi:hypothetical protein
VDTVSLRYYKSGILNSKSFNALSVKGFDDPDRVQFVAFQYPIVDGSIQEEIVGFRRFITLDLGVVTSAADRRTIQEFLTANQRSASFQGAVASEASVVLNDVSGYADEWKWDTVLGRSFVLDILDDRVYQFWPTALADNMIGYTIKKVLIVGTQVNPEQFTTNSGKLQYNFGTTPLPSINLALYNVSIVANGSVYQNATINQVGAITQVGSNISFYLAMNDGAIASSDGNIYCDITILCQAFS